MHSADEPQAFWLFIEVFRRFVIQDLGNFCWRV